MKYIIPLILIFISSLSFSQLNEKFDDGDFDNNPAWFGNTSAFSINTAFQLQLDTSGTDIKALCTSSNYISDAEWEFWTKLNFDPSANNFAKIYLCSDSKNLNANLNGYYIKIGENGSLDGIDLYRQNAAISTLLIKGIAKHAAVKPELRIKVKHLSTGEWTLFADTSGGYNFIQEGNAIDNSISSTSFFGFTCKFTSSYSKSFFFDDIYAGPVRKDSVAPLISSVQINLAHLLVSFNEPVTKTSAEDITNFSLFTGTNVLQSAVLQANNKDVLLTFTDTFTSNQLYRLVAENISDLSGNTRLVDFLDFYNYIPKKGDLLINEFMADPYPSQGLPNSEYIEIYNSSSYTFPINLNQWKLGDGSTLTTLPVYKLSANHFVILCNMADSASFSKFGPVIGLSAFPSLNNSGDIIKLKSANGFLMDSLSYDLSWFSDPSKTDGGWSLERKNPWNPCSNLNNWDGSVDRDGGTPGKINSIFSNVPDTIAPYIREISLTDSIRLLLTLNENIDSLSATAASFHLNCSNNILKISFPGWNKINLYFQNPFHKNDSCSLAVMGLKDCSGNRNMNWQTFKFQYIIPEKAAATDVIISEIFPDPDPVIGLPSYQYIELYNRSGKYISLSDLTISDLSTTSGLQDFILYPDSYLVLCPAAAVVKYSSFGKTMGIGSFPSLGHYGDEIFLKDKIGNCIFNIKYDQEFYHDDFKKDGGWSLEMIDPENYCQGKSNWRSSVSAKGGTPGSVNSVNAVNPDISAPFVSKVISLSQNLIAVFFNEKMDSSTLLNPANYNIDNRLSLKPSLKTNAPYYDMVSIPLADTMHKKTVYHISLSGLKDCAGNLLQADRTYDFGNYELADSLDLIINEVLFNPYPNGYDFLELYNRSAKIISMKNIKIASLNDDLSYKEIRAISDSLYQLLPGTYLALTESPDDIANRYLVKYPEKISKTAILPAMNDDLGIICIMNLSGQTIDKFHYSDKMHSPMLDNSEGVSLERINPDGKTGNPSNWHSAASGAGYATPGYANSIFSPVSNRDNDFYLQSKTFSPDGDGYEDNLIISYKLDTSGYFGGIGIYDINGQKVKTLVNNDLLEKEGFYSWDGSDDSGKKMTTGVYIIIIRYNRPDGFSKKIKLSCTLAAK